MARSTKPKIKLELPDKPDVSRGNGAFPLQNDYVENWAWRNDVFTPEELDAIVAMGCSGELQQGQTHGKQSLKNRDSFVNFMFPNEHTNWVFQRLADAVNLMNEKFFKFDLTGFEQGLQFTRYVAPGQHYDWHMDKGYGTPARKLSLSVQLSDPKNYKGGDFEIMSGRKTLKLPRERGFVTFFPSYTIHRVRPVKEGTRDSLVAWVSGPPFK